MIALAGLGVRAFRIVRRVKGGVSSSFRGIPLVCTADNQHRVEDLRIALRADIAEDERPNRTGDDTTHLLLANYTHAHWHVLMAPAFHPLLFPPFQ